MNTNSQSKSGCIVCSKPLVYSDSSILKKCMYCGKEFETQVICESGHFICDNCHAAPAFEIIKDTCLNSGSRNPLELAQILFKHPSIKMHGPEHHFLVPAVLLTAYYNSTGETGQLNKKLLTCLKRSKNVLGGYCGFFGTCGAAVGSGIFMSLITDSTPVAVKEWKLSNKLTSEILAEIAEKGGPRCCKRDSLIAIKLTIEYLRKHLQIKLENNGSIICGFNQLNKECIHEKCDFYKPIKEQ